MRHFLLFLLAGIYLPFLSMGQSTLLTKKVFDTALRCEKEHPSGFYNSAASFYAKGDKYGGAFLFYLGQLRYRYYCFSNPAVTDDGDKAIFASLNSTVGQEINFYLGGHVDNQIVIIDSVLSWDKRHDFVYYSKKKDPGKSQKIVDGLVKLRTMVSENKKEITAKHAKAEEELKHAKKEQGK